MKRGEQKTGGQSRPKVIGWRHILLRWILVRIRRDLPRAIRCGSMTEDEEDKDSVCEEECGMSAC
jgi:hypothetical protein